MAMIGKHNGHEFQVGSAFMCNEGIDRIALMGKNRRGNIVKLDWFIKTWESIAEMKETIALLNDTTPVRKKRAKKKVSSTQAAAPVEDVQPLDLASLFGDD